MLARMVLTGYGQRGRCRGLYIRPAVVTCFEIRRSPNPSFRLADRLPLPAGYSQSGVGALLRNVTAAVVPERSQARRTREYERMANWLAGGGRRARSTSSGAISPPLSFLKDRLDLQEVSVSRPAAGANHLRSKEPGAVQPSRGWGEAVGRCACRAGWPLGRLLPRAAVFRATGSRVPRSGLHPPGWHYSARGTSADLAAQLPGPARTPPRWL
jgi:hypothetical protein